MATSQNGYPVLTSSDQCARWTIPVGKGEARHVFLRKGHVGFVIACFILWFHRKIEKVNRGQWDEWGWAYRPIRGSSTGFSNHASGTAVDINATQHPLGVRGTFHDKHMRRIRKTLKRWFFQSVIGWGGDYNNRADEMHFEAARGFGDFKHAARRLRFTRVGRAVYKANKDHYQVKWRNL